LKISAKRANFINIQLVHQLPCENAEIYRVRTGFENTIAHRTNETFACIAKRDGVVTDIDEQLKLIKVTYNEPVFKVLDLNIISKDYTTKVNFKNYMKETIKMEEPLFIYQDKNTDLKLNDIYRIDDYLFRVSAIGPIKSLSNNLPDFYNNKTTEDYRSSKSNLYIRLDVFNYSKNNDIDIFSFETKYTSVSGSFISQNIKLNFNKGDKVKEGDVIAYNSGFFEADPYSKQVGWKHGVTATVALLEHDQTWEDSNLISKDFSQTMQIEPAHVRTIRINNKTIVHEMLGIGDTVEITDRLCIIEDSDLDFLGGDNSDDVLQELNKKSPKAKYHGIIRNIDVMYSCPIEDMTPTLANIVKKIERKHVKLHDVTKGTRKNIDYPEPGLVPIGTKYLGTEFDVDTVLLSFTIVEKLNHECGSKLVVGNQLKSTTASIMEEQCKTESGVHLDMLFSARGVNKRIVTSPFKMGTMARLMKASEQEMINIYFGKK
jgi:hypothetical protein